MRHDAILSIMKQKPEKVQLLASEGLPSGFKN